MDSYLVSVCVPVYNVSHYIERCASSILGQSYRNIEVLFIDDCSPDDSIDKLKGLLLMYPERRRQVRIISHNKNRGLAAARNTGVENSNGSFIVHVDSDDWIESDAIELLVRRQLETNADIVSGSAVIHSRNNISIIEDPLCESKEDLLKKVIELNLDHVIWRRLIRKTLYTENNIKAIEGVDIGEDHYTIPKLFFFAKGFASIDNVVYHYNCDNINSYMHTLTREKLIRRFYSEDYSLNELLDFFQDKERSCFSRLRQLRAWHIKNFVVICYNNKQYRTLIEACSPIRQLLFLRSVARLHD